MLTRLVGPCVIAVLCVGIASCGSKGDLTLPKGATAPAAPQIPRSPAPVESKSSTPATPQP